MKKKIILFSLLIVVYLLGIMSAFIFVRFVVMKHGFMPFTGDRKPGKGSFEQHVVDRFAKKLDLTDEQKKQIIQILTNNKGTIDRYRDEFTAKMENTFDSLNESIKAILTEEQKKIFDKIIAEAPKVPGFPGNQPSNMIPRHDKEMPPDKNR